MKRYLLVAAVVVALVVVYRLIPVDPRMERDTVKVARNLMGSTWTIEVVHHSRPAKAAEVIDAAFAELSRIEQVMSEWRADSPISAVNAAAGKQPVTVPAELREMLERAIGYGEKTEGAFDITWRGMGRLWRFDDQFRVPSSAEVEQARKNVDYRRIQIEGNRVFLPTPSMAIGLGGIAGGYAVDRAAAVLVAGGFPDFLFDGSGDILTGGSHSGRPWRLGIQDPRGPHGKLIGSVAVQDEALVTSGDYERYRIVDGVRYHHIIDPRTGWPAKGTIAVTVIGRTTEQADALATAMLVLGVEKAMRLAVTEQVELLLIDEQGKRHMTDGFARRFTSQQEVSQ